MSEEKKNTASEPQDKSTNAPELNEHDLDQVTGGTIGIVSPLPGGPTIRPKSPSGLIETDMVEF
jgi:hypothetical protein